MPKNAALALEPLLRAGSDFCMHGEHPDAADEYRFRLLSDGAAAVQCVLPSLPSDAFHATFEPEALARGDGVLAVSQTNPTTRHGDLGYVHKRRPRSYRFRRTTPPFLLSEQLAALTNARKPISLHFYDYLDDGAATELKFASETEAKIEIDGKPRALRIVRYEGDDDFVLQLVSGSRLVQEISRCSGEFRMRLLGITTASGSE